MSARPSTLRARARWPGGGAGRHDGQPLLRLVHVSHPHRRRADRGGPGRGIPVHRRRVDDHGAAGRVQLLAPPPSSPRTDGAVAVLVTPEAYATRHGLAPLARILAMATAGVDPAYMGMGPVPATRKALARAGIAAQDLDVVEINEAFGSQALACIRELGLREDAINLDGGGLAIGHPLGATGARITGKAAALLQREKGRYALATQCIGGGQGIATVLGAV